MKFLADENFHGPLFEALRAKLPPATLTRVQDVGLLGEDDPTVLEWAATNGFVVLTRDFRTFPQFAFDRVAAGLPMPGVLQIRSGFSVPMLVDEIEFIFEYYPDESLDNCVLFVP